MKYCKKCLILIVLFGLSSCLSAKKLPSDICCDATIGNALNRNCNVVHEFHQGSNSQTPQKDSPYVSMKKKTVEEEKPLAKPVETIRRGNRLTLRLEEDESDEEQEEERKLEVRLFGDDEGEEDGELAMQEYFLLPELLVQHIIPLLLSCKDNVEAVKKITDLRLVNKHFNAAVKKILKFYLPFNLKDPQDFLHESLVYWFRAIEQAPPAFRNIGKRLSDMVKLDGLSSLYNEEKHKDLVSKTCVLNHLHFAYKLAQRAFCEGDPGLKGKYENAKNIILEALKSSLDVFKVFVFAIKEKMILEKRCPPGGFEAAIEIVKTVLRFSTFVGYQDVFSKIISDKKFMEHLVDDHKLMKELLFRAAKNGHEEIVLALLSDKRFKFFNRDPRLLNTVFVYSVDNGNVKTFKEFVTNRKNVIKPWYLRAALGISHMRNKESVICNEPTGLSNHAKGVSQMKEQIIDEDSDLPFFQDDNKENIDTNVAAMYEAVVQQGGCFDGKNVADFIKTTFSWAARNQDIEVLRGILKNPTLRKYLGEDLIKKQVVSLLSGEGEKKESIRELLSSYPDLKHEKVFMNLFFINCVESGQLGAIRELLRYKNVKKEMSGEVFGKGLEKSVKNQCRPIVEFLLDDMNIFPKIPVHSLKDSLYEAVESGWENIVALFLNYGKVKRKLLVSGCDLEDLVQTALDYAHLGIAKLFYNDPFFQKNLNQNFLDDLVLNLQGF